MSKFNNRDNDPTFFDIAGTEYYFDLDELSSFIRIEKTESVDDILSEAKKEMQEDGIDEETIDQGQIIDITKWETTKALMECILSENSIVDEAMGTTKLANQLTIPFKISFNTLLKYNIIKENDGR